MGESLMTAANETYAARCRAEQDARPVRLGFDGWLVAVRAFAVLILGMLAISLATMV